MLSKTSIVIMGLLFDEELSAYDILKKISERNMKYWLPIGNTTLYETALRLEKKALIQGEKINSNKTVLSLTEKGKKELQDTIAKLFLQIDYDTIWFSLATLFCHVLEKQKLYELILKRKAILDEYDHGTRQQLDRLNQYHVPYQGICTIERMLQVIELEQKTLCELKEEIEKHLSVKQQ